MNQTTSKNVKLEMLSPAQLETHISDLEKKLRILRFDKVTAAVDDICQFRKLRKQIARASTYLREYQLKISFYEDGVRRYKIQESSK